MAAFRSRGVGSRWFENSIVLLTSSCSLWTRETSIASAPTSRPFCHRFSTGVINAALDVLDEVRYARFPPRGRPSFVAAFFRGFSHGVRESVEKLRGMLTFLTSPEGRFPEAEDGASSGTRTRDLLITSQLLYQLSYAGKKIRREWRRICRKAVFCKSIKEAVLLDGYGLGLREFQ